MTIKSIISELNKDNYLTVRKKLIDIILDDPTNIEAWFWLSICWDDFLFRSWCLSTVSLLTQLSDIEVSEEEKYLFINSTKHNILTQLPVFHKMDQPGNKNQRTIEQERQPETETKNLAWICPNCRNKNMSPIQLRSRISISCNNCKRTFNGASGEMAWANFNKIQYYSDIYYDWVIRLIQFDNSFFEAGFTLRNPDFGLAKGDFIIVLTNSTKPGKYGVDYLENKTSGKIIFPSID